MSRNNWHTDRRNQEADAQRKQTEWEEKKGKFAGSDLRAEFPYENTRSFFKNK